MTSAEATKIVGMMTVAWPRAWPEGTAHETARLYATMLADLDLEIAMKAVHALIQESKWMPAIAEVRERCRLIALEEWHKRDLLGYAKTVAALPPPEDPEMAREAQAIVDNLGKALKRGGGR